MSTENLATAQGEKSTRSGLRSGGKTPLLLRMQRDNLSALLKQCSRANTLGTQAAVKVPGALLVRRRISELDAAWACCYNSHRELLALADDDDAVQAHLDSTAYDEAREAYLDSLDTLYVIQERIPGTNPPPPEAAPAAPPQPAPVRLPALERIPLPIFDGNSKDWTNFHDMFTALVVNDAAVTNIHKFYYLKQSLRGNALSLIKNLSVTADTFAAAWELVRKHFQDTQVLTFSYLTRLLKLDAINSSKPDQLESLVVQTREILTSLEALGEPVQEWSSILVVLTLLRLDSDVRKDWERFVGKRDKFPTYDELESFLTTRIHAENVATIKPGVTMFQSKPVNYNAKREVIVSDSRSKFNAHVSTSNSVSCIVCNSSHNIRTCSQFKEMSGSARLQKVRSHRLCYNCLNRGHSPKSCRSKSCCPICKRQHHPLLHEVLFAERQSMYNNAEGEGVTEVPPSSPAVPVVAHTAAQIPEVHSAVSSISKVKVLLATAQVKVETPEGWMMTLRALVDQGSERTLLSEAAASILRVSRRAVNVSIVGIGGQHSGHIKASTTVLISPVLNEHPGFQVECLIMSKLTSYMPRCAVELPTWTHVSQLPLADCDPASDKPIDLLIGADVYGRILLNGLLQFPNEPVAQLTIFGWILSGSFSSQANSEPPEPLHALHVVSNDELHQSLNKFWSIEDIPLTSHLTDDERKCEELFQDTTSRDSDGHFRIHLPFKSELPLNLGESREIAQKQYVRLERRLSRDSELHRNYHSFLQEYLDLGHMIPYSPSQPSEQVCYLPHHPVLKETSTTTKLRVVFNASSHTSNGRSLNDNLLPGPVLQQDLSGIIMRWRLHRFVLSADVEKMFRQIRVTHDHTALQLILWRKEEKSPIQPFRLQTVTYGTVSAPYLSLKVLSKLADNERQNFPLASDIISRNTYVDDVVFGADTLEEARESRDQLLAMTSRGGFSLRKWSSNSSELLRDLSPELREIKSSREFRVDDTLKVLGVSWFPAEDCFRYAIQNTPLIQITKRTVLSHISKLFDPLGWIAPIIIVAKIYMQQLWLVKIDWDTVLPQELAQQWAVFYDDLRQLSELRIPRWIGTSQQASFQLHGFCDASQHAYAAAVYLRAEVNNEIITHLLTCKSKVAPLKTLTIPRLELCAAELLSRLLVWTIKHLSFPAMPTFAWSDSSVTLSWIAGSPSQWKVFVANRVSRIQTRSTDVSWHYVASEQNPADLASRGIAPSQLIGNSLWWNGPHWLSLSESHWDAKRPQLDESIDREERPVNVHLTTVSFADNAQRSSDWGKLISAAATMMRYRDILRARVQRTDFSHLLSPSSALTLQYRDHARLFWFKVVQDHCFRDDLEAVRRGQTLPRSNRLSALDPYLDSNGVLRVGGRLDKSKLSLAAQHPVILGKHHITSLIIRHAHYRTLHGGISLTMRYIWETFWIFRAKLMIRAEIAKCTSCARNRALLATQRMASLPTSRVQRHRPFQNVGVDYAGPILVRIAAGRGRHAHKAYIALFVCLATRCIHLELVSDYTSNAFLAAFSRFAARRGLPSTVMSDNGTTFQGADRELRAQFRAAISDPRIEAILAKDRIEWKFIPPASPHFGGIWESGVKSLKHHLRRVIGDHLLTLEEMSTLLCRIEACLNSRPIAGISQDVNDLSYLTPGHFLVGSPLVAPPETSVLDTQTNRLTRWKLIQQLTEQYWSIWTHEYLMSLQKRSKWRETRPNLKVGDIVLIKNDNLPPTKWNLGRVLKCCPGRDGLTRVCELRTATGILVRPIQKLCVLPTSEEDDEDSL